MTANTFFGINHLPSDWISGPRQKRYLVNPRTFGFLTFGDILTHIIDISQNGLHFFTPFCWRSAIQRSLKTTRNAHKQILRTFAARSVRTEFRIGTPYRTKIDSIRLISRLQMAVLTIHPIGNLSNASFWAQIIGGIGNQLSTVFNPLFFIAWNQTQILGSPQI